MAASTRPDYRNHRRRFTEGFLSPVSWSSPREVSGAPRANTDRIVHRIISQDESVPTSTPTPESRFATFFEVVEELREASGRQLHPQPDHSEADLHQRAQPESVQGEGGEIWSEFNRCSQTLQQELQRFNDAVQGLGSSLDLAQSARGLRECLSWTAWLMGENARKLFPQAVPQNHNDLPHVDIEDDSDEQRRPPWPPVPASQSNIQPIHTTPIHKNFKALADRIKNLREVLEQFPEFENFGKRILRCFEGDLEYWSSCLGKYGDDAESREVQIYIHDLSQALGDRMNDMRDCVKKYVACVPTVRLSQEHALSNLQTLATIATFFSAVTASTLQFSLANTNDSTTSQVVNTLWFSSLVFSIASALNSSIAFMWRSAVYSSPHRRLRGWLWLWMRQSPTIFLLISVLAFLAGLGCFAGSSQPRHIWIVVVICECVSSFSVAALLVWLVADKWSFYLLQQQQRRSGLRFNQIFGGKSASVLPTHVEHTASWGLGYLSRSLQALNSVVSRLKPLVPQTSPRRRAASNSRSPAISLVGLHEQTPKQIRTSLRAQKHWRDAYDLVIQNLRAARSETISQDILNLEHMARLQISLQTISVFREPILHDAGPATSGIQFDPEGRYLAICGKRMTMRYDVGSSGDDSLKLIHYFGVARQVIWTSCGRHIVTRTHRAVHIWTLSDTRDRKTDFRYETSGFILGVPPAKAKNPDNTPSKFISIEGFFRNKLAIIDVYGDEERKAYEFEELSIQHVDVVSDGSYLLIVAEVFMSPEGLIPMTAPPARKLIAFNLQTFRVEHEVPLWHDVQHVTISKNGRRAIVTYRDGPPPQLWSLQRTSTGKRLSLEHQFSSKKTNGSAEQVYFSGKGHFLNEDLFVLCTTTAGEIYIWRRDGVEPIHVLDQLANESDKPVEVTCNPTSRHFMFATRSQDGSVRVWKTQEEVPPKPPIDEPRLSADNMLGLHSTSESPAFGSTPLPPESAVGTIREIEQPSGLDPTRLAERLVSHSATLG